MTPEFGIDVGLTKLLALKKLMIDFKHTKNIMYGKKNNNLNHKLTIQNLLFKLLFFYYMLMVMFLLLTLVLFFGLQNMFLVMNVIFSMFFSFILQFFVY